MITYGQTSCPNCGVLNKMHRSIAVVKTIDSWNKVKCYACGFSYKHTDKLNNVTSEAEKVKQEGKY